jgi:hypothetical protein
LTVTTRLTNGSISSGSGFSISGIGMGQHPTLSVHFLST